MDRTDLAIDAGPDPLRIALASRELYPLSGGGIGQYVNAAASLLSGVAEVTVLTSSDGEQEYRRLVARGDPRLPPPEVRVAFVPEPSDVEAESWTCLMHLYSARVYERLRELYPDRGPELVEFPDFLGEGFVTLQAAQACDPFLADTRVCVRLATTAEICQLLNGHLPSDLGTRAMHAMERFSLAHAERLIWPGGDVLGTYRRFYGAQALAAGVRIRYPYRGPRVEPAEDRDFRLGTPVRILYPGRLERRKGVGGLVRAASSLGRGDFRLQLLGSDTDTGPLGCSMRELLELEAAGDERIVIGAGRADGESGADHADDSVGREALAHAIRASDLVVIPSLWECGPYTALEALHLNRPLLATPVGSLVEFAKPGVSGWLAGGTGWRELAVALEGVLDRVQWLEGVVRGGGPVARGRELTDEREIVEGYVALAGCERRSGSGRSVRVRRAGSGVLPLVSAIVPYYRASRFVGETVRSLLWQTYPRIEVVLVDDGSFEGDDWVVAELAARLPVVVVSQMNAGLGAARNFGVVQSRGRYFFPLDADNLAEPEFVARCVEVLESRPEAAYVTSWSRYIDEHGERHVGGGEGYQPLGNHAELSSTENVAGDAAAVVRRRLFDAGFRYSEELTSYEDWHFYRELRRAGHLGVVIPERLLRYRVHMDSMQARIAQPNRARLAEEIDALIRESGAQWTPSPA